METKTWLGYVTVRVIFVVSLGVCLAKCAGTVTASAEMDAGLRRVLYRQHLMCIKQYPLAAQIQRDECIEATRKQCIASGLEVTCGQADRFEW